MPLYFIFSHLYTILLKNITVTDRNRGLIVESLRSMAEIIIWGDQNDGRIFE